MNLYYFPNIGNHFINQRDVMTYFHEVLFCFLIVYCLQAMIWYTTFFGFAGVGIIRDFFRIPEYVRDINESDQYVEWLALKMRKHSKVIDTSIARCTE